MLKISDWWKRRVFGDINYSALDANGTLAHPSGEAPNVFGEKGWNDPPRPGFVQTTGNGDSGVGLFFRVPYNIAQLADNAEGGNRARFDSSPAHLTFLYIGKVEPEQYWALVDALREVFADGTGGSAVRFTFNGVDTFPAGEDGVPWFAKAEGAPRWLLALRRELFAAFDARGIKAEAIDRDEWHPHLTLGYLPDDPNVGSVTWQGDGESFVADGLELWGVPLNVLCRFGDGARQINGEAAKPDAMPYMIDSSLDATLVLPDMAILKADSPKDRNGQPTFDRFVYSKDNKSFYIKEPMTPKFSICSTDELRRSVEMCAKLQRQKIEVNKAVNRLLRREQKMNLGMIARAMVVKSILGASDARQDECELPDWLGEMIFGAANGVFLKGAGHKYIRRIPKAGGGWRYFYKVTGGHGLGSHAEFVKGAAFKIRSRSGQEGHVHILEDHGEEVTLRHDESGNEARISKAALASMLAREHAEALGAVKQRAAQTLEQARKTGTKRQQEKAAALASKYGAKVAEPAPSHEPSPVASPGLVAAVEAAWADLGTARDESDVAHERKMMRRRNAERERELFGAHSDADVWAEVQRRQSAGVLPGVGSDGALDPTSPAFQAFVMQGVAPSDQLGTLLGERAPSGGWRQEPIFAGEHFKTRKLMREGNYLTDLHLASYAAQHGMIKPHAYISQDHTELRRWNGNGWDVFKLYDGSESGRAKFLQGLRSLAIAWGNERDLTMAMDNAYKPGLPNQGAWGRGTFGVDAANMWLLTQDPAKLGLAKTGTLGADEPVKAAAAQSPVMSGARYVMPKVAASLSDWGRKDLQAQAPTQASTPTPKLTPAVAPDRYGIAPPEVLAQVNALPLPKAETRTGQTWRERRHHLGDVSIAAAGPYAVLHNAAHSQLERQWRAKRLEEMGFVGNHPNTWGQIKDDTARTGGASEVVPASTKPAPFVPPTAQGDDVNGGTSSLGRAQSVATRSKPRARTDLPNPVTGPSGAKLTAYEWQHKLVDTVDKRGEDRVRRVSDWDKAAPSEHTGRDLVHHFEVVMPSGEAKTVSAESALDLLGYTNKSERAKVRGLADDLIEHAHASARLEELEATNKRLEEAHAAVMADPATPKAFRPVRLEGMWAYHDIGSKSYKTPATIWGTMDDYGKRARMADLHRSFINDLAAERAGLGPVEVRALAGGLRQARERVDTLRQRLKDKSASLTSKT
jgi:2'-5' RNA ligase